jgi:predicted nucleic acid-binding protein
MKVLVDTNVILDLLLKRLPFYDDARAINQLVEQRRIEGCVSSASMTDIFYIARKELKNTAVVYKVMDALAADYIIAPVLESTIKNALTLRWNDFEDAVQYLTARENGIEQIITRNAADFTSGEIPRISPAEFLTCFKQ